MIALVALGAFGFLISLYFTLVFHKLMPSDSPFIPAFCRIERSSCESILNAREARLLGLPNFYLGLVFYTGVIVSGALPELLDAVYFAFVTAAGLSVVVGLYLAYSLFFKLRVHCVLCLTSHALNLIIFLLLLASI